MNCFWKTTFANIVSIFDVSNRYYRDKDIYAKVEILSQQGNDGLSGFGHLGFGCSGFNPERPNLDVWGFLTFAQNQISAENNSYKEKR